jgi:cell fate regulator YaaT (PSP1 superfamily)
MTSDPVNGDRAAGDVGPAPSEPVSGGPPVELGPILPLAGVRLRPGGRSLSCDTGGLALQVGMQVMIQSERGHELGIVTVAPARRPTRARVPRILRIASDRDRERADTDHAKGAEAVDLAREVVRNLGLDIKMFHADVYGGGRIVLFFASEARVDFRDLVRELSNRLRARVELRQVGVRDEAKMVGGIGSCGRELCCSTFLPRFAPVSIKAAKNQNLALTPSKVSGQCGRLKCCLVYEEATYVEAAKKLPRIGKRVETPDGVGKVVDLDILRGRVRVMYQDAPPKVFEASELRPVAASGAGPGLEQGETGAAPPPPGFASGPGRASAPRRPGAPDQPPDEDPGRDPTE